MSALRNRPDVGSPGVRLWITWHRLSSLDLEAIQQIEDMLPSLRVAIAQRLEEETAVSELGGLSRRTYLALRREGYTTAKAVREARDVDLCEIRGFGRVSLAEVRRVLGGGA